ncbi:MAG: hypothetical protein ACKVX7_16430 [Planctomycetota bacterium]
MNEAKSADRTRGSALIVVLVVAIGLMATTLVAFQSSRAHSLASRTRYESLLAREIAQSAVSEAFNEIKRAGNLEPVSGPGPGAAWEAFSDGEFYYYSLFSDLASASTVRAWGRVPYVPNPSSCTLAPDSNGWDGEGWALKGVEITIQAIKYAPNGPIYFGNGGIEAPTGGALLLADSDPQRPQTWALKTGTPTSFQGAAIPFVVSALNHPRDFLTNGGTPEPAQAAHPYSIAIAQTMIGQHNFDAWFSNSAGAGKNPENQVAPRARGAGARYNSNKQSPNYPYPVVAALPDVQSLALELWIKHEQDAAVTKLAGGAISGSYGDLATPRIVFVTGELSVAAESTLEGVGILLIRDAFDPRTDTDNQPRVRASLSVAGVLNWTGLVIVVGCSPTISVTSTGSATIVGALLGEDSVQSEGEPSLDSATIALKVMGSLRVLFSKEQFEEGELLYPLLPDAERKIVSVHTLGH